METADDKAVRGDFPGEAAGTMEKRHATLRCGAASLTATVRRAEFKHHGGSAGEGAP
ncbi:DUF6380 family protein [Streptomyces sp. NPDC049687]|uniref:DUF6380 family protein n=1 Tax=Streptomyces sp. NPDC049687 TaxID=3365596 RepID=UPI0037915262